MQHVKYWKWCSFYKSIFFELTPRRQSRTGMLGGKEWEHHLAGGHRGRKAVEGCAQGDYERIFRLSPNTIKNM